MKESYQSISMDGLIKRADNPTDYHTDYPKESGGDSF
jgi:hypothetical protein